MKCYEQPKLNKVMRAPELKNKKFKVFVKDGNKIKKIGFGDPNMKIRKNNPAAKKSFRARHRCDTNPAKKTTARYWSCKMWE